MTDAGVAPGSERGRNVQRGLIAVFWVTLIGGLWWYARSSGQSPIETAQSFIDFVRGKWWAIGLFIAVYTLRPLAVFPATVLTVGAGLLFGPGVGIGAAVVGANLSAALTWVIGRSVAGDANGDDNDAERRDLMRRWADRLRNDSFTTVLVMRFLFVPYDLVGYVSGFLRIAFWPFLAATAIGSLPGTVAFVLAGASIDRLDQGVSGIDGRTIAISIVLFVASLGFARLLRRRAPADPTVTDDPAVTLSATTEHVR